jgi:NADH dehydrogenase
MEKAVHAVSLEERERFLTLVIAGGGPTGVEVAGMLAEMARHLAPKEYPEITNLKYPIYLVEASSVLLGTMSKKAQSEAYRVLTKLDVNILLNTAVKDYINGQVVLSNRTAIPASTLIWTSGVIGREVPGIQLSNIGRGRRILVDDYLKVLGTNNIFAIGDIALQTVDQRYANGHPQLAQVALQQGKALGLNFKRIASRKILVPFKFRNKGSMAIISKYKAVADLPFFSCKGFFAWIVWLFVHIIPIASYRNKITLSFNWLWSFITNNPTLRLVIRPKNGE